MKKKKLTVTIGITAYNEEQNILYLLKSIVSQKQSDFTVKKIIVISDASTDGTNKIVEQIRDKRILFLKNKKRRGQNYCQNRIFELSKSDVVVLFEADSYPSDFNYLSELLKPLDNNKKIGLIQSNPKPMSPKKFPEKIFYNHDSAYAKYAINENSPEEFFMSGVGGRAFTKKVYKKLIWPQAVPEDAYANIWCKQHNIKMVFRPEAVCLYRLPQTLEDFLKKRQKITAGQKALTKYFPPSLVNEKYTLPLGLKIKMGVYLIIKSPIFLAGYLVFLLAEKFLSRESQFTDYWQIAITTKNLFE